MTATPQQPNNITPAQPKPNICLCGEELTHDQVAFSYIQNSVKTLSGFGECPTCSQPYYVIFSSQQQHIAFDDY